MVSTPTSPGFEALVLHLRESRGFDFTAYKRSSLQRRVVKRMAALSLDDFNEYQDYLEVHPDEFAALFNTILINVTSFFRDPAAWEQLAKIVVPRILEARSAGQIRIWSAGCASGEEAYTLAMVFCEAMGATAFRDRVKIYATDADEEALATARQAIYSKRQVEKVPAEYVDRYLEPLGDRFCFRKDLRRAVIFGRHDLVQDAPISRLDLLVSRNTLMYFNADAQRSILARFFYALNEGGFMFLGKAETLTAHSQTFDQVDLRYRIFSKPPSSGLPRERTLSGSGSNGNNELIGQPGRDVLRNFAFERDTTAQIVVDDSLMLSMANEKGRELFGLNSGDIGRPLQDLELSYRPVDLRTSLDVAISEQRTILIPEVAFAKGNRCFDVHVTPFLDSAGVPIGAKITFTDVTRRRELADELQQSRSELETAYEELQASNEELETTNEELQSTVEELETTNEELQSTNEELETMNEELQSTNEELEAVNDELRERGVELNESNGFLAGILTSLRFGVIVVDSELIVKVWNWRAEDLWGVRADEARGVHVLNLDTGLPMQLLLQPIRDCLAGRVDNFLEVFSATNRRGRSISCSVSVTPMQRGQKPTGAVIMMEELESPTDD